ncbi:MAG: hypothetical protein ABH856_01065 [Patescibacteria group bacterium]
MNITLSWDLFIVVFFAIIVAYSFIIGRNGIIKVIFGSYMAAFAADGLGNLFSEAISASPVFPQFLKLFAISGPAEAVILSKIIIFILIVVLLAVKGAFDIRADGDRSFTIRLIITFVYALLSAGLIVSIVLAFASGVSFVAADTVIDTNFVEDIYMKSQLVRVVVNNFNIWFFLPAVSFVISSFVSDEIAE